MTKALVPKAPDEERDEEDGEEDAPPPRRTRSVLTDEEVAFIARRETRKLMREAGVNLATYGTREEHAELLRFCRRRKEKIEAGVSKATATAISSIVAAVVAALAALISGQHK